MQALNRDQAFREITELVKYDYAGYAALGDKDTSTQYLEAFENAWAAHQVDDRLLYRFATQYLASLADRNLQLVSTSAAYVPTTVGFSVRRYEDAFHVTEVREETRLIPGDKITHVNKQPAIEIGRFMLGNIINGEDPERQIWDDMLDMAFNVTVVHADGTEEDVFLQHYPRVPSAPVRVFEERAGGVAYLQLGCFDDGTAALVSEHAVELASAPRLVIDLRKNEGGFEECFYPLFDHVFEQALPVSEIMGPREVYTDFSEHNCHMRIRQLEDFAAENADASMPWLEEDLANWQSHLGQGMQLEQLPQETDGLVSAGSDSAQKVVIITDTWCEGTGELFVQAARRSSKVTVAGRPTMGSIDYCNPMAVPLNADFTFVYPMSRTKASVEGHGVQGVGLPVDRYLAWTPEECTGDRLYELALRV